MCGRCGMNWIEMAQNDGRYFVATVEHTRDRDEC